MYRHFYMNDNCEINKEDEVTHDPFWRAVSNLEQLW